MSTRSPSGAGGATFTAGGAKIFVHERAATTRDGGPPNEDHVALSVNALDETCESPRASGVVFRLELRDYSWRRWAYLRDPDGRLVEPAQA